MISFVEQVEKFHESFELLCHAVHHHHHSRLSAATPEAELSQHRLVFVGVAVFTADLVTLLVPVDKVSMNINSPSGMNDFVGALWYDFDDPGGHCSPLPRHETG